MGVRHAPIIARPALAWATMGVDPEPGEEPQVAIVDTRVPLAVTGPVTGPLGSQPSRSPERSVATSPRLGP